MFLAIAGFNSFFIAIKVVKYVGNLSSIRVFSNTLWEGRHKNFGFLVILVLLMAGFGVFIHSYFGVQVYEVHTLTDASYTLFLCMLGQLDLEPYMEKDLPVAMVFYCVYIILFYFIAINMFLATMLNTYSEAEGQAGIMKVKEEVAREQYIKRVAYDDVAELEMDVVLELRKNEWVVAEVKRDDGEASKKGVQPGARVLKVNRRRLNKGDVRHRDAIDMINDVAPPGRVVITFADPLLKRSSAFFGKSPGKRKATVRGFWRHQGAVAWIAEQEAAAVPQADQMDEAELCARLDDLSDSSDNSDGDGDTGKRRASVGAPAAASAGLEDLHEVDDAARQLQEREKEEMRGKLVKLRTKKRLDALMFSRWGHGEHRGQQVQFRHGAYRDPDGPAPQSEGARDGGSAEDKGAEQDEAWSDQDIDDLAEELNSEPTGPELWLDCLMGALEHEMLDESVIAEVLRTSDLPTDEDLKSGKAGALASLPQLEKFRARAQTVLRILEFKAHKKYYHALLKESERRQRQLQSQNEVLHEYACELEEEFRKLMQKKSDLSATKKGLLTKLAGLLAVPYDTPRGHHEQPGHHHHHHHRHHQHLHPHSAQRSDAHG
ncbi:unnamed protein product [Prorocentrum cordatum]|uniref:Polycystin cation channel PKD1/PKD2 domain-containing protein n=1 Tax=Prorocentrum cordatum TaxID=2364126 RepID=A0ABN9UMS5_9DINO|nr:unnamed protein product [Polarella glacialis]